MIPEFGVKFQGWSNDPKVWSKFPLFEEKFQGLE